MTKTVALAGNPNVGKSTVFNALTGLNQHTGNWAGKTVATAKGSYTYKNITYTIVDLPGCYSLMAQSKEEEAARDFIRSSEADAVVVVCDATCLERNLNLVLQTMEITENVVVCVNLFDQAKKKSIKIDLDAISERLGVPIAATSARNKQGLDELMDKVHNLFEKGREKPIISIKYPEYIEKIIEETREADGLTRCQAIMAINNGDILNDEQARDDIATAIVRKAADICEGAVVFEDKSYKNNDLKADKILTGKKTGFTIMFLGLMAIFWLTISGANYPSRLISEFLFKIEAYLIKLAIFINAPKFLYEMLILGVYRVLAWVASVMLPPMAIFFPLFTLLEDVGYLPRVAFNLDKYFKKCSACGKQALTMCMGFGCNAAGIVGCRIIDSPRERLIAIITNNFAPCNGRFPTFIAILTMFFIGTSAGAYQTVLCACLLSVVVVLGIFMTFFVSKILSATVLKGVPSSFTLELPPYRKPKVISVITRSIFDRALFVLKRAVVVAAPAGLVIWLMANINVGDITVLARCSAFLDPFAKLLGMDGVILLAFILGFPANEIVIPIIIMAYMAKGNILEIGDFSELKTLLVNNGWTYITAISTILFSLLHWPCSTTCLTIKKETGSIKWTLVSFAVPAITGILVCLVFASIARLFF